MGMKKYLVKTWRSKEEKELMKKRLIGWRKESVYVRIKRPTRLVRARSLGYKAKQGFVLVRTKIKMGTRKREARGGKKPKNQGMRGISPRQSLQHISEMRVARKHPNLEVLNSYWVASDGKSKWFEVILVDVNHPCIKNDKKLKWLQNPANKRRVFRGLTSAAKKSRMLGRGKGYERKNTIKTK